MLWTVSCSFHAAKPGQIRLHGALDVLPLVRSGQTAFEKASGDQLAIQPSAHAIADLKNGQADIAIVGNDLTPKDQEGLDDHVIAYDAVCILVSSRVYNGGLQENQMDFGKGKVVNPVSKFAGLKELTLDELRMLYTQALGKNAVGEEESLPGSYLQFQPYTEDLTNPQSAIKEDPDNPGHVLGTWVWNAVPLAVTLYPAGKFDTQDLLFQKLGLPLADLNDPKLAVISPIYDSEEVLISQQFQIDAGLDKEESDRPFVFVELPASRQVTLRAIQHQFRVKAVSVDGIDPIKDIQGIYTGKYPFSRTIHLLTKQGARAEDQALIDFFLSPAGQKAIEGASFLPLPTGQ
jgi:hypothetical protein